MNYDLWKSKKLPPRASIPDDTQCLHSHFEFDAFERAYQRLQDHLVEGTPLNGLYLFIAHIVSRPDRQNDLIWIFTENDLTLVEFSGIPWVCNRALNYLDGSTLYDYGFVRFLETFPESPQAMCKLLGWNSLPRPVWENKGKGRDDFDLLKEDRQSAMQNNKEEYEWREEEKAFSPKIEMTVLNKLQVLTKKFRAGIMWRISFAFIPTGSCTTKRRRSFPTLPNTTITF